MDVFEAVSQRRSIRKFKDMPVAYEVLEKCVDAARLAPTARNCQLLEFIIVDDEEMVSRVLDAVGSYAGQARPEKGWQPGGRPKAYIVTLIDTQRVAKYKVNKNNINHDVGLAVENMILVAQAQGIGTFTIGSFDQNKLGQALNIPETYEISLGVGLGFPDESPVLEVATESIERWVDDEGVRHIPKRRLKDIVHRNSFVS